MIGNPEDDILKKMQEQKIMQDDLNMSPSTEGLDVYGKNEASTTQDYLDAIVKRSPEPPPVSIDDSEPKIEAQPKPELSREEKLIKELRRIQDEKSSEAKTAQEEANKRALWANAIQTLGTIGQAQIQRDAGVQTGMSAPKMIQAEDARGRVMSERDMMLKQMMDEYKLLQSAKPEQMSELDRAKIESERARAEKFRADAKKAETEKKEPKTEGEKVLDREFAKEYNKWETGGKVDFVENKKIFDEAIKDLSKDAKGRIKTPTGPWAGTKALLSTPLVDTDAEALQDRVRKAINGMLRATLGAQFTEKEGERIFDQTFKVTRDPEDNIKNMKTELAKIEGRAKLLEEQGNYFRKEKTLSGYEPSAKVLEKTSENKVLMQSPDGELARVPKESVESYLKKGARIIEE